MENLSKQHELVSIIIPARKEKYLDQTIKEIFDNVGGAVEIIVTLDGYNTRSRMPGVHYIHNKKSLGMRTAINQAVEAARGRYIMKLDAHCMLDRHFDLKLIAEHKDKWIQIPRRKRMDAKKWSLTTDSRPDIDYMYNNDDFMGIITRGTNNDPELRKVLLDDTESFQGSCYFMEKKFFDKLGLLDDVNFGGSGHESQEIAIKCLSKGGRIIRNKKTWYAHARLSRSYSRDDTRVEKSRAFIKILAEIYDYKQERRI